MEVNERIAAKLKDLPDNPGVYIMHDDTGEVIYVGKAVVLKNRVRQYFQNTKKQPKVQAMVDKIADFEYIITLTEKDAFALENNLIKKYKPHYNILLKDDKTSPYIRVDVKSEYPKLTITRKVRKDGAKYFGPFVAVSAKAIVSIAKGAFGIRTCNEKFRKNMRECLDYHIGLCSAPCTGRIDKEAYAERVKSCMAFLSGHDDGVERLLTARMNEAAENERFEAAINYRDQLRVFNEFKERVVTELVAHDNIDCFAFASNGLYSGASTAIIRGGKIMGMRNYILGDTVVFEPENIANFLAQYYSLDNVVPDEICLSVEVDTDAIKEYFLSTFSKKVEITFPQKGVKAKLIDTAKRNAQDYLLKSADRVTRKKEMTVDACARLAAVLGIPKISRMECYDISNISGVDKVASEVVFIDGEKSSKDYRRYRIKTVEGSDDFASMRETLFRRLSEYKAGTQGFNELPDLIVIDGGKGQLSAALEASEAVGVKVNMVGLAKRDEEIFLPNNPVPITLMKDDYALRLMQRIRDEAHRFAITYHRTLRSRRYESELKNVKNVGAATVKKVLASMSAAAVKTSTAQQIKEKAGISELAAQSIYDYFHPKSEQELDNLSGGEAKSNASGGAAMASGDSGAAKVNESGAAKANNDGGAAKANSDSGEAKSNGNSGDAMANDGGDARANSDNSAAKASGDSGAAN